MVGSGDNKSARAADVYRLVSEAISHSDSGDYQRACDTYRRACKLEPTSLTLNYNWAITALRQGDRRQVAECADRLISSAPEDWRASMVRSYLAELSGEVEKGWEFSLRAYAQARTQNNHEDLAAATADVLWFAYRSGLHDRVGEIIGRVFEDGALTEGVLAALRGLSGKRSQRAVDYLVLVEGDFLHNAFPKVGRYVRSYRVFAERDQEAGRMALDFEARCGGKGLRVVSVEKKSEAGEEDLGVWWRLQVQVVS